MLNNISYHCYYLLRQPILVSKSLNCLKSSSLHCTKACPPAASPAGSQQPHLLPSSTGRQQAGPRSTVSKPIALGLP